MCRWGEALSSLRRRADRPCPRFLGHSDYGTTLKVYAHLDPKRAKAAAGRIDAALGRTLPYVEDVAT
jgi:integrase